MVTIMSDDAVRKVLQSFKNLTWTESDALLEIIKAPKLMTTNEINKLLNDKEICSGNAGYKIIANLVKKEVLFNKKDKFEPINTNLLIENCRSASELLSEQIEGIKLDYDWKETDPLTKSQIIDRPEKLINEIYKLRDEGFTLELFTNAKDENKDCWNLIKSVTKLELKKGIHNCVVFIGQKNKVNNSGVIILSKRQPKISGGGEVFYGHIIFDEELVNVFKRGDK